MNSQQNKTVFQSYKWLFIGGGFLFFLIIWLIVSFKSIETGPGFETVVVDKPYFFGREGINPIPLKSGSRTYIWFSSDVVPFETRPIQHEEKFDDMATSDNIYVDFVAYLRLSVKSGQSPVLLEKFGEEYYKNNVRQIYRTFVRNEVSLHNMTSLTTRTEATARVQQNVTKLLTEYISKKNIPLNVEEVNFGKILPNANVLAELNRTAEQQQRKQTEINKAAAEDSRKLAEKKRAEADNAYREALGLTADQYVSMKQFEYMVQASKNGANVFFNAPTSGVIKK